LHQVAGFGEAVKAELPAGAAHVKTIGDALMLSSPQPGEAILLTLNLTYGPMRGHGAAAVRVGLRHGTAIECDGDYVGATVKLAGRVSGLRPVARF
jgi:class 3 adenylate cyclase